MVEVRQWNNLIDIKELACHPVIDGLVRGVVVTVYPPFDRMVVLIDKMMVDFSHAAALIEPRLNLCQMIGADLSLPAADVLVAEGNTVEEAGLKLTVLHTPGHTPGSVCYLCDDALFSGDTLFYGSYGRVDLPGGSMRQMRESLSRLYQLDDQITAYPGHGSKTKIVWERGMCL